MTDEIHDLRVAVEALRMECAELRAAAERQQQTGQDYDSDLLEAVMFRAPTPDEAPRVPSEAPPRRPFDIWYDFTDGQWKIYLPDGCVMVGDAEAEYKGFKSYDVANLSASGKVHCNVFAKDGSSDEYEYDLGFTSDGKALYSFPVAKFTPDATELTALLAGTVHHFEKPRKKAYVVTGVRQTIDKDEGLVLHVTKAPVLVDEPSGSEASASLSESSSSTTVATFTEVTYVTGSVYNPNSYVFYNKTRTVKAIVNDDDASSGSESVFTATAACGG